MAHIHIKHRHNLTQDQARALVEDIARDLKQELKAEYSMEGNSLRFQRSGASGSVDLGEGFVEVNVRLGLLLRPMKGVIEKSIHQKIVTALADSKGTKTA